MNQAQIQTRKFKMWRDVDPTFPSDRGFPTLATGDAQPEGREQPKPKVTKRNLSLSLSTNVVVASFCSVLTVGTL